MIFNFQTDRQLLYSAKRKVLQIQKEFLLTKYFLQ